MIRSSEERHIIKHECTEWSESDSVTLPRMSSVSPLNQAPTYVRTHRNTANWRRNRTCSLWTSVSDRSWQEQTSLIGTQTRLDFSHTCTLMRKEEVHTAYIITIKRKSMFRIIIGIDITIQSNIFAMQLLSSLLLWEYSHVTALF